MIHMSLAPQAGLAAATSASATVLALAEHVGAPVAGASPGRDPVEPKAA
jgi:hypothetical protein